METTAFIISAHSDDNNPLNCLFLTFKAQIQVVSDKEMIQYVR